MGVRERKERERQDRERKIVECARSIAENEGWPAVTTRRLADEIEYSPPVLYGHFPEGRDSIVRAGARTGFRGFTEAQGRARGGGRPAGRLTAIIPANPT
ncbi:TetR/AcrR family transcriptional regulator, partial [Rhodococcus sp. NPDC058514]|uniref:TetR/AcrR family transcriptional regulator n=1 Tax=Rhodococcus sp. NPDC058514 TaxID=3346532 RepID=UPI00365C9B4F